MFEKYTTFIWTEKQLRKKFSEETLKKYGDIIAFLYQNGYSLNCDDSEVEEQLSMFNFFKDEDDFNNLKSLSDYTSDCEVGNKIFIEEIYDIIKNTTFCRKESSDSPVIIKTYANSYWKQINDNTNRLFNIFNTNDSEIVPTLNRIENLSDIKKKIEDIKNSIQKENKVLSWLRFSNLINIIYSLYIQNGKKKTDIHKLSIASNFNDELYGGTGGYNPNTGEIKCIIGSSVQIVKSCNMGNKTKIKSAAKEILSGTKTEEDENINFLDRWYKGHDNDDDYAQQVVVNCLLNGVLTLLTLKHNLNFLEDERNSARADSIKSEFLAIMKYCNVDKEYLL